MCSGPEDAISCPEDCPGVTTAAVCGEEPHSDTGGYAVVFGINHRAASAQDCCDRCQVHAAKPANAKRPCNSWVFCPLPICWGLDTGWNHTYGECWLKYQKDTANPLCALTPSAAIECLDCHHPAPKIATASDSH